MSSQVPGDTEDLRDRSLGELLKQLSQETTQLERHRQRRDGGVGLGLYIARQLALSQDGDLLVVDPAGGRGARFELHLPLLADGAGS